MKMTKQDLKAAIVNYNLAPTSGLKAGIARKFNAEFGKVLKDLLPKVKAKKPIIAKVPRVNKTPIPVTKVGFFEELDNFIIPYQVKDLIATQSELIKNHQACFEGQNIFIESLKKRIEKVEQKLKK